MFACISKILLSGAFCSGALSGYAFWQCLSSDGASSALRALDNNLGKEADLL